MLGILGLFLSSTATIAAEPAQQGERYLRFQVGETTSYGILEGDRVRALDGDLFGSFSKTDRTYALEDVTVLIPTEPTQVLALAGNYRSHLGDEEIPPLFRIPQPFYKSPSSLVADGGNIVIPKDSPGPVHFEAELVIVIGKTTRKVSKEKAHEYVFGVTCGNDVSERYWQNDPENKDVQWWRAKGADTFGPVGPFIATGLNPDDLLMTLRLNGEVMQQERTDHLIHDVATMVSYISQYVTLQPGDLIFTGTPGETSEIKPGDVVEVELEGVGVLRNPVVGEE
ncbi:fumarylacetoacetate hydrolase family protein [Tautonia marina]|uniref:fumarylacetoacetate hydrolase family protein n=1 Tax=Tautonia marina TaxID=2653855 RepID=UPI0012610460|nr:fumarylacetoacetate hydrolase family protein [Tautonia marina]